MMAEIKMPKVSTYLLFTNLSVNFSHIPLHFINVKTVASENLLSFFEIIDIEGDKLLATMISY